MKLLFAIALTTLLHGPTFGQTNLGSAALGGVVRDTTGASVPAAIVELLDVDRGLKRETRSNEDGVFLFPTVVPGRYKLKVAKEGFDAAEITDITLDVGARQSMDVNLTPGRVSSVVSVTAEGIPQLDTESNVIGTVVDSNRVQELPLNGRNYGNYLLD